jgi:GntR family transcriptional regulator
MRTEIDRWDPEPVYVQLADILRGQIERGELVPRQPLPSETYLVQRYGVSRGTARRSVAVLREEGLVRTIPQRGSYVAQKP